MDLLQNPFHILNASPRDNRRRIMELADERSLLLDSSECMEARSELTNPRKRLSAEVAWLPGIGPKRVGEMLSLLESSPADLLAVNKFSPIARTNLLAAGLARLPNYKADDVKEWIECIAWEFEEIDPNELMMTINEERIVSGFPEITDVSMIEDEIPERRRHLNQVINSALDKLSTTELIEVVTEVVEFSPVSHGHVVSLISDIVDSYELKAQGFLEKEEESINIIVNKIRSSLETDRPDSFISPLVNQLMQVVKNWDYVAQPIQLRAQNQGTDHDASHRVARVVRDLAIHMFNEHDKLSFSQQLTSMLQEVFAEVDVVAERTAEDSETLNDIAEQRARLIEDAKRRDEDWQREITYEGYVGSVFREKFRISQAGIEWKGKIWSLDSVNRVRWGGKCVTTTSRYSSSTKVVQKVQFGDKNSMATITFSDSDSLAGLATSAVKSVISRNYEQINYSRLINCLWKAVCLNILNNYIEGFSLGKKYKFGSFIVSDTGTELKKKGLFSGGERIFCKWNEINVNNYDGNLYFNKIGNSKIEANFSYIDDDNIHILFALVDMLKKNSKERISEIFG